MMLRKIFNKANAALLEYNKFNSRSYFIISSQSQRNLSFIFASKRNQSKSSSSILWRNPIGNSFIKGRMYYSTLKKKYIFFNKYRANGNGDDRLTPLLSNNYDVVIIGGGAMGSSIAYWLKRECGKDIRVIVIEKDPTYKIASTVLSVGGLRQQFSLPENIEMSLFGAEFINNINDYLRIKDEAPIDVQFHCHGYLLLATKNCVKVLEENSKLQNSLGANNCLLSRDELKSRFPWLNVDDIDLGCLGLDKEGWFDPWSLLIAFRKKAISLGVEYITAEAKGFNFQSSHDHHESHEIQDLIVQTEDGNLRPLNFKKCVIAAGAFSAEIAKMAKIGLGKDKFSTPLPVEPRKRYVYCMHAPDGPEGSLPMTIDPSGAYFRQEGSANNFICGLSPHFHEEPKCDNLEVDQDFFVERLWPILANRVKSFENIKVRSSWAGFYEYNTFDENGIIGFHPCYDNILFATGFSGHGIQQAPAVGRAMMELIVHDAFKTIDLTRLGFERLINLEPRPENNIW